MGNRWFEALASATFTLLLALPVYAQVEVSAPPQPEAPSEASPTSPAPSASPAPADSTALPSSTWAEPAPSTTPAPFAPSEDLGGSDFFAPPPDASPAGVLLRLYGDTELTATNSDRWRANFGAAQFDVFSTADVGRLSFLSELMFETEDYELAVDLDRMQISYLFSNLLRLRAGRMHAAFGYYGDSYHHGNLFELTTARPLAISEEGLLILHVIGAGADGTFELGGAGTLRYDLDVADGRATHPGEIADAPTPDDKLVNLRLRWMADNGFIIGVNVLRDGVAGSADTTPPRPHVAELAAGAHVVYLEGNYHIIMEGYLIRHSPRRLEATTTYGGFLELGYRLGTFTPYARPEWIRFPEGGDVLYQAEGSPFAGTRDYVDLRLGLRWQPLVELAIKAEAERASHDGEHVESATLKAAFGF
jgi:hypothetical protein